MQYEVYKLQTNILVSYNVLCSKHWKAEDEVPGMAGLGGDADTHPYVSFTINLV